MGRIIAPLAEHLTVEAVPRSVEQRVLISLRHHGKVRKIVWIVLKQFFIVENGCWNKNTLALDLLDPSVGHCDLINANDRGERGSCGDEPILDPAVTFATGVGGSADIYPRARPTWAVA
ncbi:hypothetical protein SDC9_204765 [bioreactor metagenome]|uniref:Uncharacterized protein n=1 Tax=bioreactor metagenome TaxID=1076179 RepID=A0A645J0G1_9ZZZZ